MPFGKHRGRPVIELPRGYLRWLLTKVDLREPLKEHVACALDGREPDPLDYYRRDAEGYVQPPTRDDLEAQVRRIIGDKQNDGP